MSWIFTLITCERCHKNQPGLPTSLRRPSRRDFSKRCHRTGYPRQPFPVGGFRKRCHGDAEPLWTGTLRVRVPKPPKMSRRRSTRSAASGLTRVHQSVLDGTSFAHVVTAEKRRRSLAGLFHSSLARSAAASAAGRDSSGRSSRIELDELFEGGNALAKLIA